MASRRQHCGPYSRSRRLRWWRCSRSPCRSLVHRRCVCICACLCVCVRARSLPRVLVSGMFVRAWEHMRLLRATSHGVFVTSRMLMAACCTPPLRGEAALDGTLTALCPRALSVGHWRGAGPRGGAGSICTSHTSEKSAIPSVRG